EYCCIYPYLPASAAFEYYESASTYHMISYMLCDCATELERYYKTAAVMPRGASGLTRDCRADHVPPLFLVSVDTAAALPSSQLPGMPSRKQVAIFAGVDVLQVLGLRLPPPAAQDGHGGHQVTLDDATLARPPEQQEGRHQRSRRTSKSKRGGG
ncbi:unnamed protein product, partial [Pylaiella littoralis]